MLTSTRCGKGLFSQSASCADSLTVSVQPPCAIACINICAYVKNPKHWQPYHCPDTKILHTPIGMGSAALVAAVPYPGKVTWFSCKGPWSIKKKTQKTNNNTHQNNNNKTINKHFYTHLQFKTLFLFVSISITPLPSPPPPTPHTHQMLPPLSHLGLAHYSFNMLSKILCIWRLTHPFEQQYMYTSEFSNTLS